MGRPQATSRYPLDFPSMMPAVIALKQAWPSQASRNALEILFMSSHCLDLEIFLTAAV